MSEELTQIDFQEQARYTKILFLQRTIYDKS